MSRMKIMIGSLLPLLWVLAVGPGLLDPAAECVTDASLSAIRQARHGKQSPLQAPDSVFAQSIRSGSRRPSMCSGPDGVIPFLNSASRAPGFVQTDAAPSLSEVPIALARTWQFFWRAAREPRAPSLVS